MPGDFIQHEREIQSTRDPPSSYRFSGAGYIDECRSRHDHGADRKNIPVAKQPEGVSVEVRREETDYVPTSSRDEVDQPA